MKRIIYLVITVCFISLISVGCGQKSENITNSVKDIKRAETENVKETEPIEKKEVTETAETVKETEETANKAEEETEVQEEVQEEEPQQEIITLDKEIILEESSETDGQRTKNTEYAIYPSVITEKNDNELNEYVWHERDIHITFPQIYFSNEYQDYDGNIEAQINRDLFYRSLGNDDRFLVKRDIRWLVGYEADYVITKANANIISIQYTGEIHAVEHFHRKCYGITVDVTTGEQVSLAQIMPIDMTLADKVKSGELEYIDDVGYEIEYVIDIVEKFVDFYQAGAEDAFSCFYLEDDMVNIIIPTWGGNSNYIILKVPLE